MSYKSKFVGAATAIVVPLIGVSTTASAQESVPSRQYCDLNRVQSEQAASAATQATVNADRAIAGVGAAAACWLLSTGTGFLDMGVMTAVCIAGGALVSTATAPDKAAAQARDTYARYRDQRCLIAYGR